MFRLLALVLLSVFFSACHVDEPVAPPTVAWEVGMLSAVDVLSCETAEDCHDGDWCTNNFCHNGRCVFQPKSSYAILCDDGNACTKDWCYPATRCTNTPLNEFLQCGDDHPCGLQYWCEAGSCMAVGDMLCDDSDACTLDKCSLSRGCEHVPIAGCM